MTSTFEAVTTVTSFVATFMVLSISVVGLAAAVDSVTQTIENIQEDRYRTVAVTENVLTANSSGTPYTMDSGRSVLSSQFMQDTQVRNGHCFLPDVAGLNGEAFGYFLVHTGDDGPSPLGTFLPDECLQNPSSSDGSFSSPMLVRHSGDTVETRLVVYAVP